MADIQKILGPHTRRFGKAIWPTWDRYLNVIPAKERLDFDATTEANVLHRFMVAAAKTEFSGVAGVSFLEDWGFHLGFEGFVVGIDGMVVCRLKKLDDDGRSANVMTLRAKALRDNGTNIPGVPDGATFVDVGYVLNGLRTGYREVQAVRVLGTSFVMSIPREEDRSVTMPESLFGPTGGSDGARFNMIPPEEPKTGSGTPDKE